MLWYNAHPDMRKGKTATQISDELDAKPNEKRMMQQSMGPLAQMFKLQKRLSSTKGQEVKFVKIEAVGDEVGMGTDLKIYALALFRIEGPPSKDSPLDHEHILAVMKARPVGRVVRVVGRADHVPVHESDVQSSRARRPRRRRAWALNLPGRPARVPGPKRQREWRTTRPAYGSFHVNFLTCMLRSNARFPRARLRRPGALRAQFVRESAGRCFRRSGCNPSRRRARRAP